LPSIIEALVNMSKNKSPGSDGLTTEFYCKFYDCLNHILFKIFKLTLHLSWLKLFRGTRYAYRIKFLSLSCILKPIKCNESNMIGFSCIVMPSWRAWGTTYVHCISVFIPGTITWHRQKINNKILHQYSWRRWCNG
jgi:hypothetical protein